MAFIRRYLELRAAVTDADFHVVFHDNSHGIPGPSDWSIVAVLRVKPGDRRERTLLVWHPEGIVELSSATF